MSHATSQPLQLKSVGGLSLHNSNDLIDEMSSILNEVYVINELELEISQFDASAFICLY